MAGQYFVFPPLSGSGSSGSQTGVPYIVGPLDGAPANSNGGLIGSNTLFFQSATATFPGLVNTVAQSFGGIKTFTNPTSIAGGSVTSPGLYAGTDSTSWFYRNAVNQLSLGFAGVLVANWGTSGETITGNISAVGSSSGNISATGTIKAGNLTPSAPVLTDGTGVLVSGSISLIANVTGILPTANGGTGYSTVFGMGALDGAAASPNAATVGTNTLFMQSASSSNPGIVSSAAQTFSGVKTFSNQTLHSSGTTALPGISFSSDPSTGLYRNGAAEVQIVASATMGLDILNLGSGLVNVGLCGSANSSALLPVVSTRAQNGVVTFQWGNPTNGTGSATNFQIFTGTASNQNLNLNAYNPNYTGNLYLQQYTQVQADSNMLGMNIGCLFAQSVMNFTFSTASLANQALQVSSGGMFLNRTRVLGFTSSASNQITIAAPTTSSGYPLLLPTSQGSASWVMQNDGSGNLTWTAVATNPSNSFTISNATIGSVTMTSSSGGVAYTAILPGSQGSSTASYLVNDGLGHLSWTNRSYTIQQFSALGSNSYFVPATCKAIWVRGVGGGGGSGGTASGAATSGAGGGGGGGGFFEKLITGSALSNVYGLVIGSGGPGASSGNNPGIIGSSTTFGSSFLTGNGGGPGLGGGAVTLSLGGQGGAGGTATGGDLNIYGVSGGYGDSAAAGSAVSGAGGASHLSGGAAPAYNSNIGGNSGSNFGGGASGGCQINNGGAQVGSPGAQGVIIIHEYY